MGTKEGANIHGGDDVGEGVGGWVVEREERACTGGEGRGKAQAGVREGMCGHWRGTWRVGWHKG